MRFEPIKPVAHQVKTLRQERGGGFAEIREYLRNQAEIKALAELQAEGTTEEKIDWLLRRYAERFLRET